MVIGVVAAVAVVVAIAVLLGRRQSTETNSVKGYHQTLSTLEHLQGSTRRDRVPVNRAPERPASSRRPDLARVPQRPLAPPSGRRAQRSLSAMNHGSRRMGAPLIVVVVLAAIVGGLIYVGLRTHHPTPAASRRTDSTTHRHSPGTTTTTTSLPARYTAVSTTTSSATYAPATTTYTLTVGATTGGCWMSVTEANGTTAMAQTLTAGSSRSFSLSGKTTILIGAPSVATVTIDNVPAVLPTGARAPFTVTLVPAG